MTSMEYEGSQRISEAEAPVQLPEFSERSTPRDGPQQNVPPIQLRDLDQDNRLPRESPRDLLDFRNQSSNFHMSTQRMNTDDTLDLNLTTGRGMRPSENFILNHKKGTAEK